MTYTGETNERGNAHGQGVYEYADGARYEGQWKDGKRHGGGEITYADGSRYEGEWKDGMKHGFGILFSSKYSERSPDNTDFSWILRPATYKEGRLDGSAMVTVRLVDAPYEFPETVWVDGRFTEVSGYDVSEEETLGLKRIEEEIEQMREIDSNLDQGLN